MTMLNPNEIQISDLRVSFEAICASKDRVLLHGFIKHYFQLDIPQVKICDDHDAPFDFVADYIFGVYDFMIVLANRSGGKTMDFGMLDSLMAWYQPNTEVASIGAIQFQAQKAYEYFKSFSSKRPFVDNIKSTTMGKTLLRNNSLVQVLTGTISGVNSPHPQLVFLDEIDLMAWQVLQQAFSMAQSKGTVKARTVVTSTRKFAGGPMQRMITEAPEKNAKVYQWCIWEVIEKLPESKVEQDKIKKVFGAALPAKIEQANGYYQWSDVITKYTQQLDSETWETEWLCKRPGLQGVIYGSSYSDEENLIAQKWVPPQAGYIYLAEDFGYGEGHPNAVLFCWIPREFDRIVVFDELYMNLAGDDDIWKAIDNRLREYGHRLPDKMRKGGTVTGWACDYHGLTEIENRKRRGAPIMEKADDPQLYVVNNGIALVRKLFQSGRLMITIACPNLRTELLSYKKKKNLDGTYSKDPDKKMDHGPDALRYLVVKIFSAIAKRAFVTRIPGDFDASKKEVEDQSYTPPVAPSTTQNDPYSPITSDLSNMRF